jgi:adenine deaminase
LHLHKEETLEPEQMFLFAKRNNAQTPFKNINEAKVAYNFNNLEFH